jgi:hypothetical protein
MQSGSLIEENFLTDARGKIETSEKVIKLSTALPFSYNSVLDWYKQQPVEMVKTCEEEFTIIMIAVLLV